MLSESMPHQHRSGVPEADSGVCGQKRMALEVLFGPPMGVPAGVDQDRFAPHVQAPEGGRSDGPAAGQVPAHDDRIQVGELVERQAGEVQPAGVAVERRVKVGAGVGHHLDLADLELDAGGVVPPRLLAAEEVADERSRQAPVRDHAVLDRVADVD
jgi:hypothetical protein